MAKLVVLTEGFKGRSYELKNERTTVGRLDDNAFSIPEPSVSSHHCEIILRGNEVLIKDLNSTNGTFIDGNQVTEASLKTGQILRLGLVELRLDDGTAPSPPTPKRLDQTQGVKINELGHTQVVSLGADSPFKKKDNKINRVFMGVGIVLAVVVIALLLKAILGANGG